ncbi:hypothetical protein TNCV_534431 [Trichonephila clavipes]|nr:hypothetical protein TNCV_534431 [Trichonephila clavipes]
MFEKVSVLLDCLTVTLEEFFTVNDDNVCTALIMADNVILEFISSQKTSIEAGSNDKDEMNDAASVQTSSEMRKSVMKSKRNYLDPHSNGGLNNKMDGIGQFVDSLMLRKTIQRKIPDFFKKLYEI